MKAVILCGGLGTRLRPLTDTIPKPMIEVGGKPVLEHLILLCKKYGITDIYLAAFYLPEVIREYFGDGKNWGVDITVSVENTQMGSAGALKLLEEKLDETFVVLNGDVLTDINIDQMYRFHREKGATTTVLLHESTHPFDSELVEMDIHKQIKNFLPPPKQGEKFNNITKSGTVIFEPEIFKFIPDNKVYSIEKDLVPNLISKGFPVYGYFSNEYSKDMGTPERLEQVKKDFESGIINL